MYLHPTLMFMTAMTDLPASARLIGLEVVDVDLLLSLFRLLLLPSRLRGEIPVMVRETMWRFRIMLGQCGRKQVISIWVTFHSATVTKRKFDVNHLHRDRLTCRQNFLVV